MAHESPRRHSVVSPDPYLHPQQQPPAAPLSNSATSSNARPRASSQLPSHAVYQPKPIQEAVNSAFDKTDMSAQGHSDLVAQVTEQVLRTLNGMNALGQAPPSQTPSAATPVPPRTVYTPPSPVRDDSSNIGSTSSEFTDHNHIEGMSERLPGATRGLEKQPSREEGQPRPAAPGRSGTGDATTLEKIWQPLFDGEGKPTARLGQFLRGLAIHIIEDYEPSSSLVITPHKMVKFYDAVKISNEIYPWHDIFGGKMSTSSISHLYRDLKCQHHFVQRAYDEKPSIPGLTPLGFECWMTHAIRAHPDEEFERFAKAVMDMPISNADNSKERFPKQLSRRLFPKQASTAEREHFEDSILADPNVQLLPRNVRHQSQKDESLPARDGREGREGQPAQRDAPTTQREPPPIPREGPSIQRDGPATQRSSPPFHREGHPPQRDGPLPGSSSQPASVPPAQPQTHAPPLQPHVSHMERERQPYSASSSEAAVDDGPPPPGPIERERKPYYAQPGGGKVFEGDDSRAGKPDSVPPPRSNTHSSVPRPIIDPPEDHRRSRRLSQSGGQSGRRRTHRSPSNSYSNPYARSDTDMRGGSNGNCNASNLHDDGEDVLSRQKSGRGDRSSRYVPEDISRQFVPPPPRSAYEDDYHRRSMTQGNGYPPGPPGTPGYNNNNNNNGYSGQGQQQPPSYPPPPQARYT